MKRESSSRFQVTSADLRKYRWSEELAQQSQKDCRSYYQFLMSRAKECEIASDDIGQRVYSLLYVVASFRPNYDATGNPYGPLRVDSDGTRSLVAEDLTDEDLNALKDVLGEITDPEFRARVADVLWETQKDYKAAQIAVHALLDAAELRKTEDLWPPYADRLDRAAQLSARLGFGKPLHQEVLSVLKDAIKKFEKNIKSGLLSHRLMRIALSHDVPEQQHYAALAETWAQDLAAAGESDFAHRYWHLAADWYRKAGDETEILRCILAGAEGSISTIEHSLSNKKIGFGSASYWMGKAVDELRQAKAPRERINEVHRRFLELQKLSLSELGSLNFNPNDIPGFQEAQQRTQDAAASHVGSLSFEEAIMRFAHITEPTDVSNLRTELEKHSEDLIWDKLVTSQALDFAGKVADKLPPSGFTSGDVDETILRKKLVKSASETTWPIEVFWKIEPARSAIFNEHPIRKHDLLFLVANNPFIPEEHEGIYLRGIQAGFFGDWLTSMHLLIPQVESSIRRVLQQHEVVTSTLEADGTQKERDLNQLLWMPEAEKIFGPNIIFDLRGILIERFGHNMRNEFAHGLMPEGAFYQPASVYLWWLVIRLCWEGYRLVQSHNEPSPE